MEQEPVKKCADNLGCPRTEMLMQLLNSGDKQHTGILGAMQVVPHITDVMRSELVNARVKELNPDDQNEERPVTPLTCEVFHACQSAVAKLKQQMMNERGGVPMLGMSGRMPYPR